MNSIETKVLLILSGIILITVGVGILFFPHDFYESNGTILENNPSLLSEVRAGGGLLLGCGIIAIFSIFRSSMHRQVLSLSALVFLAYGIARLLSMVLDGVPSSSLVISSGIELLIGALCVVALQRNSKSKLL